MTRCMTLYARRAPSNKTCARPDFISVRAIAQLTYSQFDSLLHNYSRVVRACAYYNLRDFRPIPRKLLSTPPPASKMPLSPGAASVQGYTSPSSPLDTADAPGAASSIFLAWIMAARYSPVPPQPAIFPSATSKHSTSRSMLRHVNHCVQIHIVLVSRTFHVLLRSWGGFPGMLCQTDPCSRGKRAT